VLFSLSASPERLKIVMAILPLLLPPSLQTLPVSPVVDLVFLAADPNRLALRDVVGARLRGYSLAPPAKGAVQVGGDKKNPQKQKRKEKEFVLAA